MSVSLMEQTGIDHSEVNNLHSLAIRLFVFIPAATDSGTEHDVHQVSPLRTQPSAYSISWTLKLSI